jgi:hypothetical protein
VVQLTGPAFFFMAMFLLTVITHYTINSDRSGNLRLAMQHHDLKDISYWTSWFVWACCVNFIATLVLITFGKVIFDLIFTYIEQLSGIAFFTRTNFFVLFILFFVLSVSLTATVLLLSTFIRGSRLTNAVSFLTLLVNLAMVGLFMGVAQFIQNTFGGKATIPPGMLFYNMTGLTVFNVFPAYNFAKVTYDIMTKAKPDSILIGLGELNSTSIDINNIMSGGNFTSTEVSFR